MEPARAAGCGTRASRGPRGRRLAGRGRVLTGWLAASLLAGAGCVGDPSSGPLEPQLSSIQARVFDVSCAKAGCHRGARAESQLDLRAGRAHRNLVDVPSTQMPGALRVVPGDPQRSYLMHKLEGGAIVGERMPSGEPPLPPQTIEVLRQWIAAGAPRD